MIRRLFATLSDIGTLLRGLAVPAPHFPVPVALPARAAMRRKPRS
ncbi:hypothetical protein [Frigidibacter oleivorans]|nr:hypothetical protein [Frigidibacter oleivorans]